jgi:uncharacterized protein YuzE
MKLKVDKSQDAVYVQLDGAKVVESEQIAPGVIADFDRRNKVVGLEILNVSKRHRPNKPTRLVVREKSARKYGN